MSRLDLLGDQPANHKTDCLHFERYLNSLETTVLKRKEKSPLVTGIFGPWGSGKSTLLGLLEDKLNELNTSSTVEDNPPWVIVKFSPWLYSNEKSLLLPLLVTLAKQFGDFRKIIKKIIAEKSPDRLLKTATAAIDALTSGTPLLSSLHNLHDDKKPNILFQDEIAEAVKKVTSDSKRLVFLIDDLDRCHNSAQIVNLLEQIKLFLHLENCLFFIAADRNQVIKAIDDVFPNSGEDYLEKFIQLNFDLPPHHSNDLLNLLPTDDKTRHAFRSLSEVLGNNPRKLKRIWNEAILMMAVLKEEMQRVQTVQHSPDLGLLLKWLMIKNRGELINNPYRYLDFEARKKTVNADRQKELRDEFIQMMQLKDDQGRWNSDEDQRLAVFLWNNLDQNNFHNPAVLTLYARACGTDIFYSRNLIDTGCFDGGEQATFNQRDFTYADLTGGHFAQAIFTGCNFTGADLSHSHLMGVQFIDCILNKVRFDQAKMDQATWENCQGLDDLDTELVIYESIIDAAAEKHWQLTDPNEDAVIAIMKAYKTILNKYEANGTLTDTIRNRLTEKGLAVRSRIYPQDSQ